MYILLVRVSIYIQSEIENKIYYENSQNKSLKVKCEKFVYLSIFLQLIFFVEILFRKKSYQSVLN